MAIDKIGTGLSIPSGTITSAMIADDAISQADLGTMLSTGNSAPASPFIGQFWYKSNTGVTYQRVANADNTSFWLDISSGGIGTTAAGGVDYVGVLDPLVTHNGGSATLSVGQVYYNRATNKHFTCTSATNDANVWVGNFIGLGGVITEYLLSGTRYRVHSFLSSGTFISTSAQSVDILVVAGGGGGGYSVNNGSGSGGGGAGGFKYHPQKPIAKGNYIVTVGSGGLASTQTFDNGKTGLNSSFDTLISLGGGGGGSQDTNQQPGLVGGSGGGGGQDDGAQHNNGGAGTANQGNNGGWGTNHATWSGGGGGGASAVGGNAVGGGIGGAGGAGYAEGATVHNWTADSGTTTFPATFKVGSGSNLAYAGGGGGATQNSVTAAPGGSGVGGTGGQATNNGTSGAANTGGGGGGDDGHGGSGIVIVRYALT